MGPIVKPRDDIFPQNLQRNKKLVINISCFIIILRKLNQASTNKNVCGLIYPGFIGIHNLNWNDIY
jgi:hypothetical protein